jgi:hypothetical protein
LAVTASGSTARRSSGLETCPDRASVFSAAAALDRELGDPRTIARAALGRSGLSVTVLGVDPENVTMLEEGLSLLGHEDDGLRAQLLGRLAIEVYCEPPASRREQLSASALKLARTASAPWRRRSHPGLAFCLECAG